MTLNYQQTAWSLRDLFPAVRSPEVEQTIQEIEAKTTAFEKRREDLSPNIPVNQFMEIVREVEEIAWLAQRLSSFSMLSFSADTQDQEILSFMARVDQFLAAVRNRTLFFELWWKGLDNEPARRLMDASGKYRYFLEEMRNFKPHTLSEPEEKIINIKDVTGSRAIQNLYSTITNRYSFKIEVDGEVKELTRGELMVYVRSSDPDLRAKAYQELYRVYGDDGAILGQMYQTLVRDWRNEQLDLRHFSNPISARNLANDIPDEVVDTLLDVCKRNAGVFQRFFRLKARWIGVDRLRRYDIYAPVAEADKRYEFGDATAMVLDAYERFDPRLKEMVERVFREQHIDSEVRKGKRGGAFCASINPGVTPWVLLNYQGRADDVATMAHELGHAVHSMMASEHTQFTFHSSLPLAETASTFGEMLLIDRLMKEEQDETVRRDILFKQVDDAYATIQRQSYFAMFEKVAHQMVHDGASVEELAKAYLENLAEQFGDSVEVSDEFRWEWVSIPHIYDVPFYVYAYAFGQLLVFSLYQQYREEGESFKPRYFDILAAGGSDAPERVLAKAGIDIRSADFWQGGFDVISGLIDQLEEIPVTSE